MRALRILLLSLGLSLPLLLLSACATTPKPPEISQIKFISMEAATVRGAIVMGDYHYEEYDTLGYKIRFESDRKIVTKYGEDSFLHLDYFECESPKRYPEGHVFSARDYFPFTRSRADMVDGKSNGTIIYEAQIKRDSLRRTKQPICAQIWVYDKNTRRKIWQPYFISNKIELRFPTTT